MSCMQKEIMDFLNKVNLVIFTEYMTGMFSIRNRLNVVWRYIQPKFCMHNKDHTLMLACKFMITSLPCRVYMYTSTICRIISCTCMPTQCHALIVIYVHAHAHMLCQCHTLRQVHAYMLHVHAHVTKHAHADTDTCSVHTSCMHTGTCMHVDTHTHCHSHICTYPPVQPSPF